MQIVGFLLFLGIGFYQIFAISFGLEYALGVGSTISITAAMLLTYVPLVGSALGVYGAVNVMGWGLLPAFALFFWYVPVAALVFLFITVSDRTSRR